MRQETNRYRLKRRARRRFCYRFGAGCILLVTVLCIVWAGTKVGNVLSGIKLSRINTILQSDIPLFYQGDERWGDMMYGDNCMAVTGCGPTCLSMVVCGLSGAADWDPYSVAVMSENHGYYVNGVGSSWELMTEGAQDLGLTVVSVSFDVDSIIEALQQRIPIICSMGPGDFTDAGHFIVLSGVAENGEIIVHDPNSAENSGRTWDIETLMSQMRNLWGYQW